MDKRVLAVAAIIILLIVGGVGYLLAIGESSPPKKETRRTDMPAADKPSTEATSEVAGAYVDYREGIISETAGTKLLFFHAPWCPQCRALEADIKETGVPSGVTIIKVDYDSNQALRSQYGVTLQTTIVKVDDDGNLVQKFVAYDDPSLAAVVKELL